MKTSKGFISPLILIIIALLVLGGGYVYVQNQKDNQAVTSSNQSPLILISPNGGETYKVGDTIPIKWETRGTIRGGILMELVNGSGDRVSDDITGLGIAGPNLAGWNGSYSLNTNGLSPGKYKIYITTYGKDPTLAEDYSDWFFTINP